MRRQGGVSLVSVLIAAALSLLIVLAALRVVALSGSEYVRTEQDILMQEQAAYALELLRVALQQAGEIDASRPRTQRPARPAEGALIGLDDVAVPATTPALRGVRHGGHGGSDALAVRIAGDTQGLARNCAGLPVPQAALAAEDERGWSVFHVAPDRQGEPELRCKYRGDSGWVSQAVVGGIASFQLLYGLDHDEDGLPNDFVSAARLQALDDARGEGAPAAWTRVVAVHAALLLRSPQAVPTKPRTVELFGPDYARQHGSDDAGSVLAAAQLRPDRLYRQFDAVIFLRNSLRPSP